MPRSPLSPTCPGLPYRLLALVSPITNSPQSPLSLTRPGLPYRLLTMQASLLLSAVICVCHNIVSLS